MVKNDENLNPGVLGGIKGVLAYLDHVGVRTSQATLYRHLKQGKITALPGGGFSISEVDRYATAHCKLPAATKEAGQGQLSDQMRQIEFEKRKAQARLFEARAREVEGELVDRAEKERETLAKMIAVRSVVINSIFVIGADFAGHFGIGSERIPDVIDFLRQGIEVNLAAISETEGFEFAPCNGCPLLPPEEGRPLRCISVRFIPRDSNSEEFCHGNVKADV